MQLLKRKIREKQVMDRLLGREKKLCLQCDSSLYHPQEAQLFGWSKPSSSFACPKCGPLEFVK